VRECNLGAFPTHRHGIGLVGGGSGLGSGGIGAGGFGVGSGCGKGGCGRGIDVRLFVLRAE